MERLVGGQKKQLLKKISENYKNPANAFYIDVLLALHDMKLSENMPEDVRVKAFTMLTQFIDYEMLLTAQIFINLFLIIGPVSKYLQTSELDLLRYHEIIMNCTS